MFDQQSIIVRGSLSFLSIGPAAALGQIGYYEPWVVVDIADLADPTNEADLFSTSYGEAMDVNDELFACGWYNDGTHDQPFFLNPLDGGSASQLPMTLSGDPTTTFESGHALAINDPASYDLEDLIIVGWVEEDSNEPRAAYWEHNGTSWELHLVPDLNSGNDSYATDVGPDGDYAVGYEIDSGVPHPFIFDHSQSSTSLKAFIANAMGIDKATEVMTGTRYNQGSPVAYHYVLGGQPPTDLPNPDGQVYEEYYGMAVNGHDDVVGYAVDTDGTPTPDGVLWWYTGTTWSPAVLDQDNPNPVESTLTDVADKADGTVDIVGTYWDGNNPDGAFYVTLDATGDYLSYSLDAVASGGGQHDSFAFYPLRIRQEVEENSWTPQTYSANGINGIATIAGSYYDGAVSPTTPTVRPCLYVANDMDNDGKPDIRELLQARLAEDPELDDNGNWMLDWAENDQDYESAKNMRGGLHAPGINGKTTGSGTHMHAVENVQLVRLTGATISGIPPLQMDMEGGHYSLENIVNGDTNPATGNPACEDYYAWLREWAVLDGSGDPNQPREIIITVTNPHDGQSEYDEILTPSNWSSALATYRTFAFRFAHCIDYIQTGNECLKGSSEWAIYENNEYTPVFCLEGNDFIDLLDDGVDWVRAQAEAVRIGSALAGRPLRVIGPGFPLGVVNFGAEGDPFNGSLTNCEMDCEDLDECEDSKNKCALGMLEIAKIVQSDRLYIDLHMHYKNVSQAYEALDNMVDTEVNAWGASAEYLPTTKMVLEFGPKGDSEFALDPPQNRDWDDVEAEMNEFFTAGTPSFGTWDRFIKYNIPDPEERGWEYLQYEDEDLGHGFQMPALIGQIYVDGYSAVCYGPCIQGDDAASTFRIAALRASRIYDDDWICDQSDYFSPILRYYSTVGDTCAPDVTPGDDDDYETIIYDYQVDPFTPHCEDGEGDPCDECEETLACPGQ